MQINAHLTEHKSHLVLYRASDDAEMMGKFRMYQKDYIYSRKKKKGSISVCNVLYLLLLTKNIIFKQTKKKTKQEKVKVLKSEASQNNH